LLLFWIRGVVAHRNPVFVARPTEQLGRFLGSTDASPGLGRLLVDLKARARKVERFARFLVRLVRWCSVAKFISMGLVVRRCTQ